MIPLPTRQVGSQSGNRELLIVIIVAARSVVRRLAVSALRVRASVSLVALGLLVAAELWATRWQRGLLWADYLASVRSLPGMISLLPFALMRILVRPWPRST